MVKEIERAGIPVVHMCTVTPISMTVGANRIVPTIAIPHPLGNPSLSHDEEYALRKKLVFRALEALSTEVTGLTIFEVCSIYYILYYSLQANNLQFLLI